MKKMRQEGFKLKKTDIWDNGKTKKQYDLVYSDDEEQDDLLVNLVSQMRKDKKGKSKSRRKRSNSVKEEAVKSKKRKVKKKSSSSSSKTDILDQVDEILDYTAKVDKHREQSQVKVMKKVDQILFAGIASADEIKDKKAARSKFLDEVDIVLGLAKTEDESEEEESDDDEDETESDESDTEDLSEGEMRLLNLININKIDVKANFQQEYSDTDCHFCRKKETNEHLAKCPVYEGIMTGSEFKDIKSKNMRTVKKALYNIKSALLKRSEALAVTSLGEISSRNMKLLTLNEKCERKKTKAELIDEILATT